VVLKVLFEILDTTFNKRFLKNLKQAEIIKNVKNVTGLKTF